MKHFDCLHEILLDLNVKVLFYRIQDCEIIDIKTSPIYILNLINDYESKKTISKVLYIEEGKKDYLKQFLEFEKRYRLIFSNLCNMFYNMRLSKNHLRRLEIKNLYYLFDSKPLKMIEKQCQADYNKILYSLYKNKKDDETENYRCQEDLYFKKNEKLKHVFYELFKSRQNKCIENGFENYIEYQYYKIGKVFVLEDQVLIRVNINNTLNKTFSYLKDFYKKKFNCSVYDNYISEVYIQKSLMQHNLNSKYLLSILKKLCFLPSLIGEFANLLINEKLFYVVESEIRKASYCFWIEKWERPFIIFHTYKGRIDIFTIFHEFGHAFRLYSSRKKLTELYLNNYSEVKEIFSLGMEYLCLDYFITKGYIDDSYRKDFIGKSLVYIPYALALEEFQEYVYSTELHYNKIYDHWENISKKYNLYDNADTQQVWMKDSDLITQPFVLNNYAIAQIFVYYNYVLQKENYHNWYIQITTTDINSIVVDLYNKLTTDKYAEKINQYSKILFKGGQL